MAATFARHAPGRIPLNVVVGGEAHEQRAFGDHLDKDGRYARADEFLKVVRGLWDGQTVTLNGEHINVEEASLATPPNPVPPLYFGGSSQAAGPVAARHADVYLTWGEPPAAVAEKIDWIKKLAADQGRQVRFGIRLHVITRDTADEAWSQADKLVAALDEDTVRSAQAGLSRSESEGQRGCAPCTKPPRRRHLARRRAARDRTEPVGRGRTWCAEGRAPRWWAATTESPTGSPSTPRSGIDEFIFSGYPHLRRAVLVRRGRDPDLRPAPALFDVAALTWRPPQSHSLARAR